MALYTSSKSDRREDFLELIESDGVYELSQSHPRLGLLLVHLQYPLDQGHDILSRHEVLQDPAFVRWPAPSSPNEEHLSVFGRVPGTHRTVYHAYAAHDTPVAIYHRFFVDQRGRTDLADHTFRSRYASPGRTPASPGPSARSR